MKAIEIEGVVRRDELYTLGEFERRLRLGRTAMRTLRRRGLPVIKCGTRKYVSGNQAIVFMEGLANEEG